MTDITPAAAKMAADLIGPDVIYLHQVAYERVVEHFARFIAMQEDMTKIATIAARHDWLNAATLPVRDVGRIAAKYRAEVEVDPDVLAVRAALHAHQRSMTPPDSGWGNMSYLKGSYDHLPDFQAALAAYKAELAKRGIEIGKAKP